VSLNERLINWLLWIANLDLSAAMRSPSREKSTTSQPPMVTRSSNSTP
jgi:hypothetical protein